MNDLMHADECTSEQAHTLQAMVPPTIMSNQDEIQFECLHKCTQACLGENIHHVSHQIYCSDISLSFLRNVLQLFPISIGCFSKEHFSFLKESLRRFYQSFLYQWLSLQPDSKYIKGKKTRDEKKQVMVEHQKL